MFQVNLKQIRQQLYENMDVVDENDFETSFMINGQEILVSFYKSQSFNEYNQYGLDHWILVFFNVDTDERREIWVPLPPGQLQTDEVVDEIISYIKEGYLEDLI